MIASLQLLLNVLLLLQKWNRKSKDDAKFNCSKYNQKHKKIEMGDKLFNDSCANYSLYYSF